MLVVLEGLDGVGKSVQSRLLQDHFDKSQRPCQTIHFPRINNSPFGSLIQKYLTGGYGNRQTADPYLIATLFINDQYLALKSLQFKNPQLIILLDRYYYSNLAYQGAHFQNEKERKQFYNWFNEILEAFDLPDPDLAIYLYVPQAFQHANLEKRTKKDLLESSLEYQEIVRDKYLEMIKDKWRKLETLNCWDENNSMLSKEKVHGLIIKRISKNQEDNLPYCEKK